MRSKQTLNDVTGPSCLILTPYQVAKDDIYGIAKEYLDAAEIKCICIYENDDKLEQIEKLKDTSSNFFWYIT